MRYLFPSIFSVVLFISCQSNIKPNNIKNDLPDSNAYISHRALQKKEFRKHNFTNEQQWDSLNNTSHKQKHKQDIRNTNYRTFGWHIYSNGTAYKNYNFSLLWGISYFSYSIDPETGTYKSIHQWKTTPLIDSAKTNNCKVFLSVSNFGKENNALFLNNAKAQETLIDSLSILLAQRDADGINIDFEGVAKKDKIKLTDFIFNISKRLKEKDYMVSLCLYAVDWNDVFDIKSIDPYIDFYTLMGYDYYGSFSKTTGPVTPFKTSKEFGKGLQSSVAAYNTKGVKLNKLIVGLPYYGAEWYTKTAKKGAAVTKFNSHPPYKTIKRYYIDSLKTPIQFDTASASSYLVLKENENKYRQIFFEDTKSLSIKYDWIKNKKIGGVGIWALGYDDGYDELWDLLSEKFSKKQNNH